MEQAVRLRIDGVSLAEWKDDFEAQLRSGSAPGAVEILSPKIRSDRLALADVVLIAIITGGASVVAATITAIAAVCVAKLARENKPSSPPAQTVVVNLIGSRASSQLNVEAAAGVRGAELKPHLERIGQLREISAHVGDIR